MPHLAPLFFIAFGLCWVGTVAAAAAENVKIASGATASDHVKIALPETESGHSPSHSGEMFNLEPVKVMQAKIPEPGKHHLDVTAQKIVSRLTSQEMDEINWLDSVLAGPKVSISDSAPGSEASSLRSPITRDPALAARIVTIPMSVVPPRLQAPGSSKGMPPKMRIVEIHHSRVSKLNIIFRRGLHHSGKDATKVSKKTFSVDLHGGIIGVGEYYSVIELGSKKIRVQVDTGSSTLAGTIYPSPFFSIHDT